MLATIISLGVLIFFAGIALLINPNPLFDFITKNRDKTSVYILAVVVRLILGALLVAAASQSNFPFAIQLLGWLIIVVAIGLILIGKSRFERLIGWLLSSFAPYARIGGILALIFSGVIFYAFV